MLKKYKTPSIYMYLFLLAVIVITYIYSHVGVSINYDVFGYYSYLPAYFIYHDLGFSEPTTINSFLTSFNNIHGVNATSIYTIFPLENGNHIIKYTSGWAVCYMPFFFIGHFWADASNYFCDGFSEPYHNAILMGAIFYTLLGVYFLRKLLLLFFSEKTTAIAMFIMVFGSNYFIHTAFHTSGAMTHNHLFALVTATLYFTHKWYSNAGIKNSLILGLLIGLIALTRATELTVVFAFLFWYKVVAENKPGYLKFWKTNFKYALIIGLVSVAIVSIQFFYWKTVSGDWICNKYSYDAGEGFDFDNPHIIELLFSFRKGWFVYTPLMMFIFFGLYKMYQKKYKLFWPLFVYTVVNIYLVSSWSNWWYADSYSCRALIPYLSVFALAIGYLYEYVYASQQSKWYRTVLICLFSLLFIYSEFKIWQSSRGILHGRLMSKKFYFESFFLFKRDMDLENKYLLFDRFRFNGQPIPNEAELSKKESVKMDFEESPTEFAHEGKGTFVMNDKVDFSPLIKQKIDETSDKFYFWVRIKAWVYLKDTINLDNSPMISCCTEYKGDNYNFQGRRFVDDNIQPNKWSLVHYDYLCIEPRSRKDTLVFCIWNPGKIKMYIDNFSTEIYEPISDN